MEAEEPAARTLEETTALVRSVYKTTWDNFYIWEQDHCRRTLHSLARTPSLPRSAETQTSSFSERDYSSEATTVEKDAEKESFTLHDYNRDTGAVSESTLLAQTVDVVAPLRACPPYEMCTPASRNIYVGDDFEEMPFIQLVDDPTFDLAAHMADYKRLEWQLPDRDPDCKFLPSSSFTYPACVSQNVLEWKSS